MAALPARRRPRSKVRKKSIIIQSQCRSLVRMTSGLYSSREDQITEAWMDGKHCFKVDQETSIIDQLHTCFSLLALLRTSIARKGPAAQRPWQRSLASCCPIQSPEHCTYMAPITGKRTRTTTAARLQLPVPTLRNVCRHPRCMSECTERS